MIPSQGQADSLPARVPLLRGAPLHPAGLQTPSPIIPRLHDADGPRPGAATRQTPRGGGAPGNPGPGTMGRGAPRVGTPRLPLSRPPSSSRLAGPTGGGGAVGGAVGGAEPEEDPGVSAAAAAAMALLRGIFIVSAKRTPFGAYGGLLKDFTAIDLAEVAARSALSAGKVSPEIVDSVIVGNVMQSSVDAVYLARHVGLRVGVPVSTPALTVNRLCGSGFQSVVNGCQEISLKESEVVLCGGAESMSQAPYAVRNIRFGIKLGVDPKLEDVLWASLTDAHIQTPMGVTAENLAAKYNITREECDRYAFKTQQRWKAAHEAGHFKAEMAPVEVKVKKGKQMLDHDEHPRPETTMEHLGKLPTVFKKDGTVTAGNASGVSDGAGAVILASEDAVKKHNLAPLARIVSYHAIGCDPNIMGIGPVAAITEALKKASLSLKDMDLVEVNEAFAPQYLSVEKVLGLDPEKTNVNGGAIALGHPLAASGSRITSHLVHELRRRKGKYAVGSACIGGGQGIAVIIQNTA